jgi:hypothetical protein
MRLADSAYSNAKRKEQDVFKITTVYGYRIVSYTKSWSEAKFLSNTGNHINKEGC